MFFMHLNALCSNIITSRPCSSRTPACSNIPDNATYPCNLFFMKQHLPWCVCGQISPLFTPLYAEIQFMMKDINQVFSCHGSNFTPIVPPGERFILQTVNNGWCLDISHFDQGLRCHIFLNADNEVFEWTWWETPETELVRETSR